MFGFVLGALTGGLTMLRWGDRIRDLAANNLSSVRKRAGDALSEIDDLRAAGVTREARRRDRTVAVCLEHCRLRATRPPAGRPLRPRPTTTRRC